MNNLQFLEYEQMSSIDDVVDRFNTLEKRLLSSKLEMLHNFNQTYLIITKNVRKNLKAAHFDHPEFLNFFDAHFAKYYLQALDNYLLGNSVPPAWKQAFDHAQKRELPPMLQMALGVNAHVNNDISQVLKDCGAEQKHYKDYKRINRIIRKSMYEVMDSLDDQPNRINPKNKIIKRLSRPIMSVVIYLWRRSAWKNYQKMRRNRATVHDIEKSAHDTSVALTRLPL
jgi:hypothetical protein